MTELVKRQLKLLNDRTYRARRVSPPMDPELAEQQWDRYTEAGDAARFAYACACEKEPVFHGEDIFGFNRYCMGALCKGRFGITFPQFAKVDVNGENAIPLFKWLTENTKFNGFGRSPMGLILSGVVKKADRDYKNNGNVKWNFTKFLTDKNGDIVGRFEPTDMKSLKKAIEECLK